MHDQGPWPPAKDRAANPGERTAHPTPAPAPARVLVVDDHPLVRFALKQVLVTGLDYISVDEAASGAEALSKVQAQPYDVVVLDLVMAGRNGLEILQDMKAVRPSMPVLILTAHPSKELALRTLRAGAAGYVAKTSSNRELLESVKKVLLGTRCVSANLAEAIATSLGAPEAVSELPHKALSNREYEVLCFIGAGISPKDIAQHLGVGVKTVNTFRSRLLQKMGMQTNAELVRYAIQHELDSVF
jgi:two-component system, NarL family, invasion response regulator UvrY